MSHPRSLGASLRGSWRRLAVLIAVPTFIALTGCTVASSPTTVAGSTDGLTPVKLQLKWFVQGQFSGYLAADALGYYKDAGLDVDILNGGPDISSQSSVAQGSADFAVAWTPAALASREQGAEVTNVAQIFERSALRQYSFVSKGLKTPADLKGKKVGVNGAGNGLEVLAGLSLSGLDPTKDVDLQQQQGSIKGLLNGDLDAVQGATYNEYGQLLSTTNPATNKLYTADDFNVINWSDAGAGMLEDGIWASSTRLQDDPAYAKTTQAFVTASLKGWIYCRDNIEECRDITSRAGSSIGASLQLFQVNGVNQLIWPSTTGIGTIDEREWKSTVEIAKSTKDVDQSVLLKHDPSAEAYTNDYVEKAQQTLTEDGLDTKGTDYVPAEVTLQADGK